LGVAVVVSVDECEVPVFLCLTDFADSWPYRVVLYVLDLLHSGECRCVSYLACHGPYFVEVSLPTEHELIVIDGDVK